MNSSSLFANQCWGIEAPVTAVVPEPPFQPNGFATETEFISTLVKSTDAAESTTNGVKGAWTGRISPRVGFVHILADAGRVGYVDERLVLLVKYPTHVDVLEQ